MNDERQIEPALQRYIDGEADPIAKAQIEALLQRDPALAAEVETLRRIGTAIRRTHDAPPLQISDVLKIAARTSNANVSAGKQDVVAKIDEVTAGARRVPSVFRRFAVAAAIMGGVVGVWLVWKQAVPHDETARMIRPAAPPTGAQYYQRKVREGFEPDWVCSNDEEFIATFRDRFGQGLALQPMPDGTRMLGLDYNNVLSPISLGMLAESDGEPVLVIIDRASEDRAAQIDAAAANLQVFRRQQGDLVLYELTPLHEERVLPFLQLQP